MGLFNKIFNHNDNYNDNGVYKIGNTVSAWVGCYDLSDKCQIQVQIITMFSFTGTFTILCKQLISSVLI